MQHDRLQVVELGSERWFLQQWQSHVESIPPGTCRPRLETKDLWRTKTSSHTRQDIQTCRLTSYLLLAMSLSSPIPYDAIPSLSTLHSGVPDRLTQEAVDARQRLTSQKTLPRSIARRKDVPLPPDVSKEAFYTAIKELRGVIGDDNVVLNDQPLVDGWYMEHP